MNQKDYFILGCKLFGIYCFVTALPYIVNGIGTFFIPVDFPTDYKELMKIERFFSFLNPAILIGLGIYLIIDGGWVHKMAYPTKMPVVKMDLTGKLSLFLKLLGIFLIISAFPDFLRTVSGYLVYTHAPKYYEMNREKSFVYLNALPSIGTLILGFYLLIGGKFFLRIGLKQESPTSDNTAQTDDSQT